MNRVRFIRNAARALIICDNRLLVVHMRNGASEFFILPGGGQRPGETLHQTLQRECREEIGCGVHIAELLYVREYIGKNHQFARQHHAFQQLEMVFRAHLESPGTVCPGHDCDKKQIGVCWLDLDKIRNAPLYPEAIRPFFQNGDFLPPANFYLGDCN